MSGCAAGGGGGRDGPVERTEGAPTAVDTPPDYSRVARPADHPPLGAALCWRDTGERRRRLLSRSVNSGRHRSPAAGYRSPLELLGTTRRPGRRGAAVSVGGPVLRRAVPGQAALWDPQLSSHPAPTPAGRRHREPRSRPPSAGSDVTPIDATARRGRLPGGAAASSLIMARIKVGIMSAGHRTRGRPTLKTELARKCAHALGREIECKQMNLIYARAAMSAIRLKRGYIGFAVGGECRLVDSSDGE